MAGNRRQPGFSLTETLLAVATLAIGLTFIAGTFLTGIYLSTFSTERTIASVAAEEAFAKVRIYGLDPNHASLKTDGFVAYEQLTTLPAGESLYPSIDEGATRQYSWSLIARRVADGSDLVQCTAFVSRETGGSLGYWTRGNGAAGSQLTSSDRPHPVLVNLVQGAGSGTNEIAVQDAVATDGIDERTFINNGSILVDDATGQIYRVLERAADQPDRIELDRPWAGAALTSSTGGWVWVVPPPTTGGRAPCVAVYQKVLRFPRQ